MRVDNPKARQFYIEECLKSGWSVRQLERQIHSFFYERLLASHGDKSVHNEIYILEPKKEIKPTDILKSNYVLEFLDLDNSKKYHERISSRQLLITYSNFYSNWAADSHLSLARNELRLRMIIFILIWFFTIIS